MGKIRKGRDIDSALCKKGFHREIDGDHLWYTLISSNVKTKISHGMMGHDIGPELQGLIAKQLHLTKRQFSYLIDCSLDAEGYREILRNAGFDV